MFWFYRRMINPINFSGSGRPNSRLSIFHINDLHGQTDNLHATLIASKNFDERDSVNIDKLKLSGGDNVSGGDSAKNMMIASFLNAMNLDATAIGNHEFDAGLNSLANFIAQSKAKFVSANLDIADGNPIKGKVEKSLVKEINGTKYGIIGLTTPELPRVATGPEVLNGIKVEDIKDTIEEVQEEVEKLRSQGINRIIALSHSGYEFDKELAKNTNGIDVIVSGHSHDAIESAAEGKNLVRSKTNEPVLIVQAGDNGRYYGVCDVDFDQNGLITKISNNLTKTTAQKSSLVEYVKNVKMGPSPVVTTINEIDPFPANKRIEPCAWANLICDGMKQELGTDIVLVNSANIRKVPSTGTLTQRDIFETTPMKNELLTTTISEKEIVDALKFASKSVSESSGDPGILQVSGLDYTIDKQGNLLELNFTDKKGKKKKIDINNPSQELKYTVAMDDFVIDGREYPPLKLQNREIKKHGFDKDKTAANYITKMTNGGKTPLSVKDDGRVRIVQTSTPQQPSNNTQNFLTLTLPKSA